MDRMASMAVFTKVVGTGSFSAAAREMKLSQASVNQADPGTGGLAWRALAQSHDAAFKPDGGRLRLLRTLHAHP